MLLQTLSFPFNYDSLSVSKIGSSSGKSSLRNTNIVSVFSIKVCVIDFVTVLATEAYQPGPHMRQEFNKAMRHSDDTETVVTERTDKEVVSRNILFYQAIYHSSL